MDRTNKHLHLLDKIKNLNVSLIENMSSDVMAMVTDCFDESLVKNVVYVGKTNMEQRKIIKKIKDDYKHWKEETDFMWRNSMYETYPKHIEDLQLDIECGIFITPKNDNKESDDPISNNHITKQIEAKIAEQDAEIKELQEKKLGEITQKEFNEIFYSEKNNEAKGKEDIHTTTNSDNKLKSRIKELEEEIADLEKRVGIDAPKAALLVRIVLSNYGGLPPNRENAWPIITNLWGVKESNAKKRLRESVKEETVEVLASIFKDVSPKIERFIREEGGKIIVQQKNKC